MIWQQKSRGDARHAAGERNVLRTFLGRRRAFALLCSHSGVRGGLRRRRALRRSSRRRVLRQPVGDGPRPDEEPDLAAGAGRYSRTVSGGPVRERGRQSVGTGPSSRTSSASITACSSRSTMSSISFASRSATTACRLWSRTARRRRRSRSRAAAFAGGVVADVADLVLVVRPDPVQLLAGDPELGGDLRQGGERGLGRAGAGEVQLLDAPGVLGQPGPPDHRGQGRALHDDREQDDDRRDEHEQVAVRERPRRSATVVGTASAVASETAPRKPAHPEAVRCRHPTRAGCAARRGGRRRG